MNTLLTEKPDFLNIREQKLHFGPPTLRVFYFLLLLCTLSACSAEEDDPVNMEAAHFKEITDAKKVYKGIFATKKPHFRGTFKLVIADPESEAFKSASQDALGTVILHTGEIVEARPVKNKQNTKAADFTVDFDSEDLSFSFFLDEAGNPVITDVIFKKEEGSIIIAEHSAESTVTPITGIYRCTNCQDQESAYRGIELNNEERTFNMLLTSADDSSKVNIQAVIGTLIDAEIAVQENCTSNEQYTFCTIKSGADFGNESIIWSGVHRFTKEGSTADSCSSISGNITFLSSALGPIEAEFYSDGTCPDKTYYVSPSGNDANTGTSPQDAWQTIAKVNSIDINPGDMVLFEGSNSYSGNLYLDSKDGNNSANPVKISSYGTGRATILAGDTYGIYAYNTSGIKIDNLIVAGSGMNSNTNSGIYFYNDLPGDVKLDLVEITNCEVYGFKDFGIVIGGYNGNSGYSNVLIENNKVHDILDAGISSYGEFSSSKVGYAHSNIIVRSCEVYNIKGYDKGQHSGNGILLADVQHSIIEHSTVYDSGSGNANKSGGPVGIWYWDADQVTIQYNEVYGMASGTNKDGGGFDLDGGVTNGTMQYNYSHDNEGAGYLVGQFTGARPMQNITVRYNISENDASTNGGSIALFNGSSSTSMKDIYVHNNTLYTSNPSAAAIKYISWVAIKENINFYNNILYAENGAAFIDIPSGYDGKFMGNLYYTSGTSRIRYKGATYNSLADFRKTGNETLGDFPVGHEGDPMLTAAGNGGTIGFGNKLSSLAAYKIQAGSPAINAGVDISLSQCSRDFYGTNLLQNVLPEIGAHANLDGTTKALEDIVSK